MTHKPLDWISKNCVFPDSAGKELARKPVGPHLLDFQKNIIRQILSPEGEIQSNAFIYGCRKVSKSFLWSMIIWFLINDKKRRGFRMPVMASVFYQAKLLYEQMICQPYKKEDVRFLLESIRQKKTMARVDFFANAPGSALGQENDGLCCDEIGAYKSDSTLLTLSTGGALSPDNFLKLFSSNPPLTDDHFVLDLLKSCDADSEFKVHRFILPPKKDWTVEKNWGIANPFIREFFDSKGKRFEYVMRFYRSYFNRAQTSKPEEHAFRRYLLGQYCGSEMEYIPLEKIKTCGEDVFKDSSIRWALGCDFSITHDFTSVSLVGWSQSKNKIFTKCFLYLPNTNRRRESQKRMFLQWEKSEFLKIQKLEVLNSDQVASDVLGYLTDIQICPEAIVFDKALSGHHIEKFKGFKSYEIKMTAREMTPAIRELERVGCDDGLNIIGGNDCVKWQFGNIICSQKSKNYVLMDRPSAKQNIDAPVSITLGLKHLIENPKQGFVGFAI